MAGRWAVRPAGTPPTPEPHIVQSRRSLPGYRGRSPDWPPPGGRSEDPQVCCPVPSGYREDPGSLSPEAIKRGGHGRSMRSIGRFHRRYGRPFLGYRLP